MMNRRMTNFDANLELCRPVLRRQREGRVMVELPIVTTRPDGTIEKRFARAGAIYSRCERYRYSLFRTWETGHMLVVIGLNPSTATESQLDPTIRRCIRFAKDWDFGGLFMLNIFAFRATDPRDMKSVDDPIGPANDDCLMSIASKSPLVLAAWGSHGQFLERSTQVKQLLNRPLHCLGTTKAGQPSHPLYIPADRKPQLWWSPTK